MRLFLFGLLLMGFSACTATVHTPVYPEALNSPAKTRIFVATNRGRNDGGHFDRSRGAQSEYLQATVSLPSSRKPGEAPQYSNKPDFQKHYVLAGQKSYENVDDFSRDVRTAARAATVQEVAVFVHGFYNSYANSLFRAAQIKQDFGVPGPIVNFSWPSAGRALGYNYDNESVLFARDDLEKLLLSLAKNGPEKIVLIGHSRGSLLITETLRQMEIRQPGWAARNLDGVLLISPDMPVEIFQRSVSRYADLPQPFALMTSSQDRALRLSSRINGSGQRLGQITDATQVGDLPITLLNVSNFSSTNSNNHNTFAESPALISLLRDQVALQNLMHTLQDQEPSAIEQTVQVFGDTTSIELFPGEEIGAK
ncbi:MAG: alpha/beta hydrolase [Shimia sp.]|jgi:esterase/lipase superfamily enzyme|uniref:alpha/beta hydrolase n=1 Tax=Shimia sp. TaxID=1954381 RepID=UPI00405A303F